ncbi:MAG: site-specific integrase [Burkholderiaceae bacterium]|nr:site-specific integrase [Burkholderiaceae bacterium]
MRFLEETADKRSHKDDKGRLAWLHHLLGGKCLDEIDRTLIDHIKAERIKIASKSTANRYLSLIRRVLRRAALEWEWIDKVPNIRLFPEDGGRVRSLSREEFRRLHRELPPHLADMALFAVVTGLRQSNVKGLRWECVDLELRHAWVIAKEHKNGKYHSVPLNDDAMAVLLKRQGQHPVYVFTYEDKPIHQVSTKAWRHALERAGIEDFRWHDLRHTWATWHRQAGTPTYELQRLGGWKTPAMVERYAHIAPEGLQRSASRIDNVLGYASATPETLRDKL